MQCSELSGERPGTESKPEELLAWLCFIFMMPIDKSPSRSCGYRRHYKITIYSKIYLSFNIVRFPRCSIFQLRTYIDILRHIYYLQVRAAVIENHPSGSSKISRAAGDLNSEIISSGVTHSQFLQYTHALSTKLALLIQIRTGTRAALGTGTAT